ncbi:MAG: TRAP transporter large permease subunit [Tepidanaerobacter acetatoxydans]|uniref:TRAP transporter large permease subunit n=1 Tax=Tepidanaerobacter TaxID=499228 RepID=UPI0026EDACC3|nr:TRAP transporter large permease subunit [Tepidanaerobacter acetatoxydans]NLU09893.1 TRAP transporter large permease subunit [Tepidanaerobacter acetatoxydans]
MQIEFIIFIVMVLTFMAGCFAFKLPVSIAMVLASIAGTLIDGSGIPIRHLVEGTFGYIDTILVIATAMIFMGVIQESGALDALSHLIIKKFHKRPAILLIFLMLVVMFPGMITGSSTASVISAGSLMAPVFMMMGIPRVDTAAIIAMGGILGMIAPPVNVPAMIIGGGVDIPYVGFEKPLLMLTIPVAIFTVLYFGLRHTKDFDYKKLAAEFFTSKDEYSLKLFIPLIVVFILMIATKAFPNVIPDLGMPLIFTIGSIVGLFTGKKVNILKTGKKAVKDALPVLGILMGVGMFIQVMTLTGVRGFIVVNCLSLPSALLYVGIALAIPAFGAVSSFGSASVLGVPFLLALLGKNEIITVSALSFISGLGDLVPPTALAGIFAAQVVDEENYVPILKKCLVPALVILVYGLIFIIFAKQFSFLVN